MFDWLDRFTYPLQRTGQHLSIAVKLDHAEPAVGSQIHGAPAQVKIWFTEKLEPALNKIQVFDSSGQQIDKRDIKIDQSNGALLTVSLPELKPGKYKVLWRAVSVDTHKDKA